MKKQNIWAVYRIAANEKPGYPVKVAQTREDARWLKNQMVVPSLYRVAKVEIKPLSFD